MRKVTASAVILTAVTGCSQSKAPSATWSFEPPATEAETAVADSLSQFDSSAVASLSPAAQRFLDLTDGGEQKDMMGPAFEQPDTLASAPADSIEPTPQVSIPIQTRPRTDPIAEVRSYLARTRSSSFLGDRVPYSAQIPLPAAPDYTTSIYSQQAAATFSEPLSESLPTPTLSNSFDSASQANVGRNDLLPVPVPVATSNDAAQAIADLNQPPFQFSTSDSLTAAAQPPRLTSFGVDNFAPTESASSETVATSASQTSSAPVLAETEGETFPLLSHQDPPTASQQVSEGSVVSPPDYPAARDESVSIGTAILNDLHQSSESEAAEALATGRGIDEDELVDSRLAVEIPVSDDLAVEDLTAEELIVEGLSVEEEAAPSVDGLSSDGSLSVAASTASTAIEPMVVSERYTADDKLARLLQTLPTRSLVEHSEAPLISHLQLEQPEQDHQTFVEDIPGEDAVDFSSNLTGDVTNHPDESIPSPSGSLLLEGLEDTLDGELEGFAEPTDALQTLYLPIPGTPTVSASTTFIQTALTMLERSARDANVAVASDASHLDDNRPGPTLQTGRLGSGQAVSYRAPASAKSTEPTSERPSSHKGSQRKPAKYRQRIVWR